MGDSLSYLDNLLVEIINIHGGGSWFFNPMEG